MEYALKNSNSPIGVATYKVKEYLTGRHESNAAGAGGDC